MVQRKHLAEYLAQSSRLINIGSLTPNLKPQTGEVWTQKVLT